MDKKRPLIILTGPTAVGKTALSIALAKAVDGEIISADSMQVYKGMNIGTAKITPAEMEGVPHYMIDILSPEEEFNVVEFKKYALKYMEEIYTKGKIPVIVGGTGFYIQALLYDIDFCPSAETDMGGKSEFEYKKELESLLAEHGSEYLHNMLKEADPEYAEITHANNTKRVIRALAFYKQTGEKLSAHNDEQRTNESPYNFEYFVLNDDRKVLYDRIDKRVDMMFADGLTEEVKNLLDSGIKLSTTAAQGIGYKETIAYLNGEISLEEAEYIIKRDTRHFAKRQLTWFRREKTVTMINKKEFKASDEILQFMLACLKNKCIIS